MKKCPPSWAILHNVNKDNGYTYSLTIQNDVFLLKKTQIDSFLQQNLHRTQVFVKSVLSDIDHDDSIVISLFSEGDVSSLDTNFVPNPNLSSSRIRCHLRFDKNQTYPHLDYGSIIYGRITSYRNGLIECDVMDILNSTDILDEDKDTPTMSILWQLEKDNTDTKIERKLLEAGTVPYRKLNLAQLISKKQNKVWAERRVEDALRALSKGDSKFAASCIQTAVDLDPSNQEALHLKLKLNL